jgi:hypothetical protein
MGFAFDVHGGAGNVGSGGRFKPAGNAGAARKDLAPQFADTPWGPWLSHLPELAARRGRCAAAGAAAERGNRGCWRDVRGSDGTTCPHHPA